jgi:hypothetical protein
MQKVIILAVLVSLIGFYQVDALMCYSCALCTYPITSSTSQTSFTISTASNIPLNSKTTLTPPTSTVTVKGKAFDCFEKYFLYYSI